MPQVADTWTKTTQGSHQDIVETVLQPGAETDSSFSPIFSAKGTVYEKTDAQVEMKKINREEFWEQAKVGVERKFPFHKCNVLMSFIGILAEYGTYKMLILLRGRRR